MSEADLRVKLICEQSEFASEANLQAKRICKQSEFASKAILRAKRICERSEFVSETTDFIYTYRNSHFWYTSNLTLKNNIFLLVKSQYTYSKSIMN